MKVTTYASAKDFLAAAGEWLEREEVLNNMILGLAGRLAKADKPADPPAVMMTVASEHGLEAAIVMTPPRGVSLYTPTPQAQEALEALAEALLAGGHAVPECFGPCQTALAFARIWSRRAGQEFSLKTALRLYELREVIFPAAAPGAARSPGPDDLDLLAEWAHRFALEVCEQSELQAARASVEDLIAAGRILVWEAGGQPVSMAATTRPLRHGIAVSRVFTPPEHRGHGYASACVADLSQRQLNAGKQFCCLYTDLANPTSNSIYQKIGYRPVADANLCIFNAIGQAATLNTERTAGQ